MRLHTKYYINGLKLDYTFKKINKWYANMDSAYTYLYILLSPINHFDLLIFSYIIIKTFQMSNIFFFLV